MMPRAASVARMASTLRVVAERFMDEGETVAANAPLLRIVELDPVTAVFAVTERDYGLLRVGQAAALATDAFPGERFRGEIVRIAPVFQESTCQARVDNAQAPLARAVLGGLSASTVITLVLVPAVYSLFHGGAAAARRRPAGARTGAEPAE